MISVADLLEWLDEIAPFCGAEDWDNVGLLIGDYSASISRILVSLDVDNRSVEEAISLGCECIVSHHPIIFKPLSSIVKNSYPSGLIHKIIENGISIVAVHTNLDASLHGPTCLLADYFGLTDIQPIKKVSFTNMPKNYFGMGAIGKLDNPQPFDSFLKKAARCLPLNSLMYCGNRERIIQKVAICSGSGGSLVGDVVKAEVDCFISGEIKYHEAQLAVYNGCNVISAGHFATEFPVVKHLVKILKNKAVDAGAGVEIFRVTLAEDIFKYYAPL